MYILQEAASDFSRIYKLSITTQTLITEPSCVLFLQVMLPKQPSIRAANKSYIKTPSYACQLMAPHFGQILNEFYTIVPPRYPVLATVYPPSLLFLSLPLISLFENYTLMSSKLHRAQQPSDQPSNLPQSSSSTTTGKLPAPTLEVCRFPKN